MVNRIAGTVYRKALIAVIIKTGTVNCFCRANTFCRQISARNPWLARFFLLIVFLRHNG